MVGFTDGGPSVSQAVPLDAAGYGIVADTGSFNDMVVFIKRMVRDQGQCDVDDDDWLQATALSHSKGLFETSLRSSTSVKFWSLKKEVEIKYPSTLQQDEYHGNCDCGADAVPTPSAPAQQEVSGQCPICIEDIWPSDAAMRCNGHGGMHHYFHSDCMKSWIAQVRNRNAATCPVCRGSMQFHAQRLDDFLSNSTQSQGLSQDERGFLQHCADRVRQAGGSWGDAITWDNALHVGSIVASAAYGFTVGYSFAAERSLHYDILYHQMGRSQKIAQNVGYGVGVVARIFHESAKEERRREERERDRDSERRRRQPSTTPYYASSRGRWECEWEVVDPH